jgi:hypothetical protein
MFDNVVPQQRHQEYLAIRDAMRAYDWTKGSREEFRREYTKVSLVCHITHVRLKNS